MMRTKKDSEKKRKRQGVFRTGSKGFIARLNKGYTVRVSFKNWVDYWASVQDPNRERYQRALEAKDQKIIHLQEQLTLRERLFDETIRVLESEKDQRISLETKYFESIEENREIKKLLVALLVPWASFLGPRKLRQLIEDSLGAMGEEVPFSVLREVLTAMMMITTNLTNEEKSITEELESGEASPIDKVLKVFLDSVRKTFSGYL